MFVTPSGIVTEIGGGYYLFTPNLRNELQIIISYNCEEEK